MTPLDGTTEQGPWMQTLPQSDNLVARERFVQVYEDFLEAKQEIVGLEDDIKGLEKEISALIAEKANLRNAVDEVCKTANWDQPGKIRARLLNILATA